MDSMSSSYICAAATKLSFLAPLIDLSAHATNIVFHECSNRPMLVPAGSEVPMRSLVDYALCTHLYIQIFQPKL
jgi:hypothetical protein